MFEGILKGQNLSARNLHKKQIVQRPGEATTRSYYVKSGLLRSYTIDEDGKEHVIMFAPEGWIISDIESYAMDVETDIFIDALEDSIIIEFDLAQIHHFFRSQEHQPAFGKSIVPADSNFTAQSHIANERACFQAIRTLRANISTTHK